MRLLLVEDEERMAQALCEIFRLEKYDVDHFSDGMSGLMAIQTNIYDILILDVMLPEINGFEIARRTRQFGINTPILILTAKSDLDDKVMGLDCGADDYLTKPFIVKELLARLRALSRRNIHTPNGKLSFGDITLNVNTSMLTCHTSGQCVRLSEKEFHILEYLIANHECVLTREMLAMKLWGFNNEAEYNNVEVYMTFTRRKLNYVGAKTEVKAIRGIGYMLRYENV